ncbi:MAG: hypothetical protein OXC07_08900 [Kistimonas sp.]|nr:hypothetical protein [Kistimonas sp.]
MFTPAAHHFSVINHKDAGPRSPAATSSQPAQYHGRSIQPLTHASGQDEKAAKTASLSSQPLPRAPQESIHSAVPQTSMVHPDFGSSRFPINYVSEHFIPDEELIEPPRNCVQLDEDPWWRDEAQDPATLDAVLKLLQERQEIEEQGGEFAFKPLLKTLQDMQIFIGHIQAGKQFDGELTPDEAGALQRLAEQTTALVEASKAPYKRTLRLALSMQILCEIITYRQVLAPLIEKQPELIKTERVEITYLCEKQSAWPQLLAHLPLCDAPADQNGLPAVSLPWLESSIQETLQHRLNDQHLLLYPSFHPLTVEDFCRFIHLPVYPVGLTTNYLQSADGQLMSPLLFAEHDLSHMNQLSAVGQPGHRAETKVEFVLCCHRRRLNFRQLLLDQSLSRPRFLPMRWALIQLSFILLHELSPHETGRRMGPDSLDFFSCLQHLAWARREEWNHYTKAFRDTTDALAAAATLWTVRLWQHWQAANYQLTPNQLQACAQTFEDKQLPLLLEHMAFTGPHRGTLRQLFAQQWLDTGRKGGLIDVNFPGQKPLNLFQPYFRSSGLCNVDHTDLAYLMAQSDPQWRDKIEKKTGAFLPEAIRLAPAKSEPMEV